ncbi:MAG: hypothetical protein IKU89_01430 [Oscillospiraceae bacterium]|nr:hypothetical protein [Oscillospiraceae bacterium]
MKKALIIIIVSILAFSFCGCQSSEPVAGEDLILAARGYYKELDSARVDIINDSTGESEQIFIYKYDEKGAMTYCYVSKVDGEEFYQYNNGYEQFTRHNGEYSVLSKGDKDFVYYTKDTPHAYAGEGLIAFYKKAVSDEGSFIASDDRAIVVCHQYDVSKMEGVDASVASFKVEYFFDATGRLLYFRQTSGVKDEEGAITLHSYTIYITEENSVKRVPNPTGEGIDLGDLI